MVKRDRSMPSLKELEQIVEDYEKRIDRLKKIEEELNSLNTKGFEKEVIDIKSNLKKPKQLEKVEQDFNELKRKIQSAPSKESRPPIINQSGFPHELGKYYTNISYLGKGGFARVYKVTRNSDGKTVAVKLPISMSRSIGKSFIKEMISWPKLKHLNIVELYDYNITPVPFFEMELCDSSLSDIKKPLEIEKACSIVFDICEGLKYAHKHNIIHRDIKPQNILFKDNIPKLSDWGLSKLIADSKSSSTTSTALTLQYCSPEQISKKYGNKDEQTDIWQIGVIFYELVTGRLPFDGDEYAEILFEIASKDHEPPSAYNEDAHNVDDIINKCLKKTKTDRYKSISDLQNDIGKILNIEISKEIPKASMDPSKSAYWIGELLLVNLKIGEAKEAYKMLLNLLKSAPSSLKEELEKFQIELEEIIENELALNDQIINKADILIHKVRVEKNIL
jgi:eukaryotic-like serine/threonine-protein kinase